MQHHARHPGTCHLAGREPFARHALHAGDPELGAAEQRLRRGRGDHRQQLRQLDRALLRPRRGHAREDLPPLRRKLPERTADHTLAVRASADRSGAGAARTLPALHHAAG